MIVPLSAFCTQRMGTLVDLYSSQFKSNWISHFGWRPSKLFDNVNRALSIIISGNNPNSHQVFTTTYQKWVSESRDSLMSQIAFINSRFTPAPFIIPKIGELVEQNIAEKIWRHSKANLGSYFSQKKTANQLFYRNTGGLYWKIITDFQPEFYEEGKRTQSSRESHLYFTTKQDEGMALAVLNSNLFWWYYVVYSNCRDLNPYDLQSVPVGHLLDDHRQQLMGLSEKLMIDMKARGVFKERAHGSKSAVKYQEFSPKHSKPIIDEIDRVLAQHYGFSAEELDFIINYDIKYRMGREADSARKRPSR